MVVKYYLSCIQVRYLIACCTTNNMKCLTVDGFTIYYAKTNAQSDQTMQQQVVDAEGLPCRKFKQQQVVDAQRMIYYRKRLKYLVPTAILNTHTSGTQIAKSCVKNEE